MKRWRTLSSETLFEAAPVVTITRERVGLPDGREIDDFYRVGLRSYAITVPVLEDGRILLTRAYKHGPGRVCLSFPGGFIDPDESPQDAAAREMLEETGFVARQWQALGSFVDNGNQQGSAGHYFLASGCRQVQPAASGDLEEMRVETYAKSVVDRFLADGSFAITHDAAAWAIASAHGW